MLGCLSLHFSITVSSWLTMTFQAMKLAHLACAGASASCASECEEKCEVWAQGQRCRSAEFSRRCTTLALAKALRLDASEGTALLSTSLHSFALPFRPMSTNRLLLLLGLLLPFLSVLRVVLPSSLYLLLFNFHHFKFLLCLLCVVWSSPNLKYF